MSDKTKEQKELEKREKSFDEGYQKLVQETNIALRAIITPHGPVLQKIDVKEAAEQLKNENKTAE